MRHIFKYILNLFYRVDNSDGSLLKNMSVQSETPSGKQSSLFIRICL